MAIASKTFSPTARITDPKVLAGALTGLVMMATNAGANNLKDYPGTPHAISHALENSAKENNKWARLGGSEATAAYTHHIKDGAKFMQIYASNPQSSSTAEVLPSLPGQTVVRAKPATFKV
jgi:hypothetical protein